jgi:CubicO group peptidase (beta-lactamase class C family)
MTENRIAGWRRKLSILALIAVALTLIGWRVAIYIIERAPMGPSADVPTCLGRLDPSYAEAAERARQHLTAMLVEREIPGLAVAVAVSGRLVWSEGLGLADCERGIAVSPNMQFRLHSLSKLVTAAGMARLVERGVLNLDAPVRTYLSGLPTALGASTPRQLASHRAGVRHYRDDNEALDLTKYETAVASLKKFRNDPLLFPPDSGSAYSSYGFVLLSAAMEGATGLDFPTLIRREVFVPLSMDRTEAERCATADVGRATFYDNVTPYSLDGRVHRSPPLEFSSRWAAGGILSTVEDMVCCGSAHIRPFNQGFLRDETIEQLFTPRTRHFMIFGQGLGWTVARDHRLRRVRLHFGAGSGGTSFLVVYPDQQVSIAVLANLGHARFPLARLLGVVNLFVGDWLGLASWTLAVGAFCVAVALLLYRRPAIPSAPGSVGAADGDMP